MRVLRGRRGLVSIILAITTITIIYIALSDIKVAIFSDTVIRKKEVNNDVLAKISDLTNKEIVSDAEMTKNSVEGSIMPLMPDPEAKKELGRASWKYFHTLLARFPDEPTDEQREKLKQFIQLYAELYPCGECSHHFVKMLEKHPVQTSSRTAASMWGCFVHNKVNEYLNKEQFDCATVLENYDCGCGTQ